jgi:hypothetical protein
MIFSSIHVVINDRNSFFLWLNSIPLCTCTTFIHWLINGHLGCFHFLATVNSATINMRVQIISDRLSFPLVLYPGVGLLHHVVVLFIPFYGTSILFSIMAVLIYIPTNSVRVLFHNIFTTSNFFFFGGGTGVWTHGFALATQAFYHLSHARNSVVCLFW